MSYGLKLLKRDYESKAIPQIFDVVGDDFAPLTGQNLGSGRYGQDSFVWGKTASGLYVPLAVNASGGLQTGYTLKKVSANFNRPADTTAYTIGDAVTDSTSSPSVIQLDLGAQGASNGQAIEIRKIAVVSSVKPAGAMPLFNVYLSNATFIATNDNSELSISDATIQAGGAFFHLTEQNYTAANCSVEQSNIAVPMVLAAADNKLYGIIQAMNAYTPTSGETFYIIIWAALL